MIPNNGLLQADNIHYKNDGSVRGRRGIAVYGTPGTKVTSMWRHYPRSGSAASLAQLDTGSSSSLRHDTASNGTFAAISGAGSYATGKPFYYTNWGSKDRTFLANGVNLLSYNGTITTVVQTPTQCTGPYLTVHQSRLFITKQDEINYSVYATNVNDETTIDPANQLNVSDPQGGSITGLSSRNDRLLIYKSTCVWMLLGDIKYSAILNRTSDIGCIAPLSLQNTAYGDIYVGRAGVYLFDGVNPSPVEVSGPIRFMFANSGVNNVYANAVGIWYPRNDTYVLKLNPTDAYCFAMQRVHPPGQKNASFAWSRYPSYPLVAGMCWDSEGDTGDYFVSDTTGKIYRCDYGTLDDAVAYQSIVQTSFMRIADKQQVGRIHYMYVNFAGTQSVSVGLRYDNASSNALALAFGGGGAGLRRARQRVNDQVQSGQFVSAQVTLPLDGPVAELYTIRLDPRIRSKRVWR